VAVDQTITVVVRPVVAGLDPNAQSIPHTVPVSTIHQKIQIVVLPIAADLLHATARWSEAVRVGAVCQPIAIIVLGIVADLGALGPAITDHRLGSVAHPEVELTRTAGVTRLVRQW
jgi:hypothetical protein